MSAIDTGRLGEEIKQARERFGWSLTEVADRSGLSRAYINALERGRGKRPGADVIRRLEDVLGPLVTEGKAEQSAVPLGLGELARERNIPESEIRLLAGLRIRGRQPQTVNRWRFIYDALVSSEAIDQDLARSAEDPTRNAEDDGV